MTVTELSKVMCRCESVIRAGIVQGKLPFAVATKLDEKNKNYNYVVFEGKVKEYITNTTLKDLTIHSVAEMLGVDDLTIRVYLQRGLLPFGVAYKTKADNKNYTYVLFPAKVEEYLMGRKKGACNELNKQNERHHEG